MSLRTTTYWIAACIGDSTAYSARRRTKREILKQLAANGFTRGKASDAPDAPECFVDAEGTARYEIPVKVAIQYTDQMDLIEQLRGEGSGSY